MYDPEIEAALTDEDQVVFTANAKYQVLDASCTYAGKAKLERREIHEDEIEEWAKSKVSRSTTRRRSNLTDDNNKPFADSSSKRSSHLKIICFQQAEADEKPTGVIPVSQHAYGSIKTVWKLPDWLFRFADGAYSAGLVVPYGALTTSKFMTRYGLAMKNANSHRMFAFYDPEDRTTRMAIAENAGIDDFTVDDILSRVEKCEQFTFLPILAPFLMAEGIALQIMQYQANNNRRKEDVERKQAFYAYSDVESESDEEEQEGNENEASNEEQTKSGDGDGEEKDEDGKEALEEEDDLVGFTREFTKLYSLARSLQRSLEDNVRGLDLLQRMHDVFLESLDSEQQKVIADAWQEVYERLVFILTQMHQTANLIADNQSEVQQSIQTIYALIGTNDSHLNYESAQASVRIADDSRRVAVLARQDSTDMRIIAATTLLFLPPTFVATLFSTNFFNFKPTDSLVSKYIWLYFAVSVLLTVPVMLAWRILSKARAKETAKILRAEGDDVPKAPKSDADANDYTDRASGLALHELRLRLNRRLKKTPTILMEEK